MNRLIYNCIHKSLMRRVSREDSQRKTPDKCYSVLQVSDSKLTEDCLGETLIRSGDSVIILIERSMDENPYDKQGGTA